MEGRVVVDVGCSTGRHCVRLRARRPSRWHVADRSPDRSALMPIQRRHAGEGESASPRGCAASHRRQ